jgi:hypothetical protein
MARQKQEEEDRTIPNQPPQPPPQPHLVDHGRPCKEFQYAVKLVSGIPGPELHGGLDILAPGRYYTAINIHNPATCKTVTFRWKVAQAYPLQVGPITRFQKLQLRPDEAIEIDSINVARLLDVSPTRFLKGFVVIESPCPLDVVAVYSIGAPAHGQIAGNVVAFHTERVPERRIEACRDDLKLDLATGVAEWTLIAAPPPVSTPRPASVVTPVSAWTTQTGAQWVSAHDLNQSVAPGTYIFQSCFTLCSGYENAQLQLSALADNSALVWVNNHLVGSVPGFGSPTSLSISSLSNPNVFLPGLNCLSFVVTNLPGAPTPMGLNVHGTLTAERGACPDCGGCCSDCGAEKVYPKGASQP